MLLQRPRRMSTTTRIIHPAVTQAPGFAGKLLRLAPSITGIAPQPMFLAVPRAKKHDDSSGQQPDDKKPLTLSDRIMASTSLDELLTLVEDNSPNLSPAAVSSSLLRAAHLKREEGRSLSEAMRARLPEVVSQHIERHMTERISEYDAFTLGLCAQKLATMRMGRKSTFRAIESEAITKLRDFDPRGLSSLLRAFAKACFPAPQLFQAGNERLCSDLGVVLKEFSAQDLSNLLWAHTKAGQQPNELFMAVDAHLNANHRLLMDFRPQDFCNILWAYATADVPAPKLFKAVESHLNANPELIDRFSPQGLFSNVLWAYATAGVPAPSLFEAVDAHLNANPQTTMGNFKPQALCQSSLGLC